MIKIGSLSKAINEELKPCGFTKRGSTWYLSKEEVIGVLNLQKSNYDNSLFLNIGFWLLEFGDIHNPKEEQCHVRTRASELWRDEQPSIGALLCEDEQYSDEEARSQAIQLLVRKKVVPLMVMGTDICGLTELLRENDGFLIRNAARQRLGIVSENRDSPS